MNTIIFSFLFFLPAGIANMVPVFAAKIPGLKKLNYPLDFGKKFQGKRILGDHKTIRGFVLGILVGTYFAFVEHYFFPAVYEGVNPLAIGFLLSFGALAGDSLKSFFKRRAGVASGKSWFPFDQLDYIFGGLLLSLLVVQLSVFDYVCIVIVYFVLHMFTTYIGFLLKFKVSAM